MDKQWMQYAPAIYFTIASIIGFVALVFAYVNVRQAKAARLSNTLNHILSHVSNPDIRKIRRKLYKDLVLDTEELGMLINAYDRCALLTVNDKELMSYVMNFQASTIRRIMEFHYPYIAERRAVQTDYARSLENLWSWAKENARRKWENNSDWPSSY